MKSWGKILLWYAILAVLFFSPFVYIPSLFDFANLPQAAFIQTAAIFLIFLYALQVTGSQRSEIRGQRSEVGGQKSEVGDQRSEVGGQRSKTRGQRSEVRDQRSEVRGLRSADVELRREPFIAGGITPSFSWMDVAIGLFLIWTLVSLLWARNGYEGFFSWIHLASCAAVYFVMGIGRSGFNVQGSTANVPGSGFKVQGSRINDVLLCLCAAGTGIAILGCLQHLFQFDMIPQAAAPAATFGNRNVASQYVSMIFPITAAMIFLASSRPLRFSLYVALIIQAAFLFFAQTRSGWIAGLVSLAFVLAAGAGFERIACLVAPSSRKKTALILTGVLLFGGSIFILNPQWFQSPIIALKNAFRHEVKILDDQGREKIAYEDSKGVRLAIWRNSLEMVKEHPLIGFGLGNFKIFYPAYHQRAVKDKIFREEQQLLNAHNDFIQIAVETGLIGLAFFLVILATAFVMVFRLLFVSVNRRSGLHPDGQRLVCGNTVGLKTRPTWDDKSTRVSSNEDFRQVSIPGVREQKPAVIGVAGSLIALVIQMFFSFPMQRALPPLVMFVCLAILSALYSKYFPPRTFCINVKRPLAVIMIILFAAGGFWLVRFQYRNLMADYHYRLALEAENRSAWAEVINHASTSVEYVPSSVNARSALGRGLMESGETGRSIDVLEKLLQNNPYHLNGLVNLGIARNNAGDPEKAIQTFERVLAIKPDYPKVLANMGKILMKEGRTDAAIDHFSIAVRYEPEDPLLHNSLGFLMVQKGRFDHAEKEFEEALRVAPELVSTHRNLALLYVKFLKQPDKAIYHMKKYIESRPDDRVSEEFRRIISSGGF